MFLLTFLQNRLYHVHVFYLSPDSYREVEEMVVERLVNHRLQLETASECLLVFLTRLYLSQTYIFDVRLAHFQLCLWSQNSCFGSWTKSEQKSRRFKKLRLKIAAKKTVVGGNQRWWEKDSGALWSWNTSVELGRGDCSEQIPPGKRKPGAPTRIWSRAVAGDEDGSLWLHVSEGCRGLKLPCRVSMQTNSMYLHSGLSENPGGSANMWNGFLHCKTAADKLFFKVWNMSSLNLRLLLTGVFPVRHLHLLISGLLWNHQLPSITANKQGHDV